MDLQKLTHQCVAIAKLAGDLIEQKKAAFEVNTKQDDSPVTSADLASEALIIRELQDMDATIPILSEESFQLFELAGSSRFWCIDPLDGTKDFIHQTGDYTVNIALIDQMRPILGVIHCPQTNDTYYGFERGGAWHINHAGSVAPMKAAKAGHPIKVVTSRFHLNEELRKWVDKQSDYKLVQRGSSLKFCMLASGFADLYPRLTPVRFWDVAAAHCILEQAEGSFTGLQNEEIQYSPESEYKITGFVAQGDPNLDTRQVLSALQKLRKDISGS